MPRVMYGGVADTAAGGGAAAAATASTQPPPTTQATDPNCDTSLGSYCGSAVFRAILAGDFEESRSCRLQVEADAAVARVLLRYVYTGRAVVSNDVFRATQHPDLADACARFFGRQDVAGVEQMAPRRSFQDLSAPELR
eukprot:gene17284-32554_t